MNKKRLIIMSLIYCAVMIVAAIVGMCIKDIWGWLSVAFLCGCLVTWIWLIITVHICGDKKKGEQNDN